MPVNQAILVADGLVIAIDSGLRVESYRVRWGDITLEAPDKSPARQLQAAGLSSDAVTHLLLTHAHYDHCGGLLDGEGRPQYPRAQIVIHAAELEHLRKVDLGPDRFYDDLIAAFLNSRKLEVLAEEQGTVAGIGFHHTGGHTPGHTFYHTEGVVFSGDLFPTVTVLRQPAPQESDTDPDLATEWRNRLQRGEFGDRFFLCHGGGSETVNTL